MNVRCKRRSSFLKLTAGLVVWWLVHAWWVNQSMFEAAEQPKPPPQTATPNPSVAIADSEIIPRAEQTVKSLQKIRSEVTADPILKSIERDFAGLAAKSDQRHEMDVETLSKSRSVQQLNEILREWSLEQSQLAAWDQALAKRSTILVARQKDIDRISETWRATQAAVEKKFFFKAVLERRVDEVLREAQATRLVVQEHTTKLLKLQGQMADRVATLAKIRAEIDLAREEFSRSLLTRNSPPLWQALFQPEAQDIIGGQAAASVRRFMDDVKDFLQKYGDRILWHAAFFLAMVALFYFLRRGLTPEVVERIGDASALFILDRLVTTAFLLASIALPLFYPGAALAILRMAILPTVIPVIRLLPRLLPKAFGQWIYVLVILYVLDFLRYLLPAAGLLTRLLLLLIAAGGCIALGFLLRSRGTKLSVSSSSERLMLRAVRVVMLLFGASAISNFLGNITLAEILVAMPIRIAYAAALIFAGAHLLMTLAVVALQSRLVRWLRSVRDHGDLIAFRCRTVIRLASIILWTVFSLYTVGVLGDISAAGAYFLQLRWKVGAAEISIQDVAAFIGVFLGAVIFSRMLRFVLTEEILPRIRLPRGVPGAVDVLSRYGIMLLGFFIALAAAGVDLSKVTLLISALGVGIGFGLQNVVNNFVSGLILVFEHPLQVGDSVEVGTVFGEVRKIGFRASVLRTPDGADVVIPNSEFVGARFINWSLSDWLRRISIPVAVAYGTDPNRVIDLLVSTARRHPAVLADPVPFAVFDRFGDSALNFTLLCWTSVDAFFLTRSELTIAISNAFDEAGIKIPFPQQDVHIHWSDEQRAATAPASAARSKSA